MSYNTTCPTSTDVIPGDVRPHYARLAVASKRALTVRNDYAADQRHAVAAALTDVDNAATALIDGTEPPHQPPSPSKPRQPL